MPGPAAHATTASGTGCSRASTWLAKWVIRIRSGRPGGDAGLDGRARVVDVHVDVPQVGPADDEQRVAEPVEGGGERLDRLGGGVGEQVHHLVGRPLAVWLGAAVERVVPGQGR